MPPLVSPRSSLTTSSRCATFFLIMFFFAPGTSFDLSALGEVGVPALVMATAMLVAKPPVFRGLLRLEGEEDRLSVEAAIDAATGGNIEQGSVGGGTGMICQDFKGGSGSASRVATIDVEATDEAVIDSMVANTDMTGRDGITVRALPHGRLCELLAERGVLRLEHGRNKPG